MVRIKICGITNEEDLYAAIDASVDAVGFVVNAPFSPRSISPEKAQELMSRVPPFVDKIAVVVLNSLREALEVYNKLKPDYLQIHLSGHTPLADELSVASALREKGLKLIRAIRVSQQIDLTSIKNLASVYTAVLLDSYVKGKIGGTGRTHDWNISRQIREELYPAPVILAGGLTPENVREAILTVRPYAVDVSSGVEKRPGRKDRDKILKFVKEVRRAEREL